METIVKFNIAQMKADIKTKVEEQRFLKNQRKTVKIIGERKIPAKDATYKHMANREDLRAMYAAYGVARGHSFSQIENHYPEEGHPLQKYQKTIDRILDKYKMLVKVEVSAE
jgi:hypothetical protein